jgi:hypothetical protein
MTSIKTLPDLVPQVLATGLPIGGAKGKCVFKALLDTGGTGPMINHRCIPKNAIILNTTGDEYITTAGLFVQMMRHNSTICVFLSSPLLDAWETDLPLL